MARLTWYWHRLRAMSPVEMLLRGRRKLTEMADAHRTFINASIPSAGSKSFPILPPRTLAPAALREALREDVARILSRQWTVFGHLQLQVDDPPKWQRDYLGSRDLTTARSAFALDHRALSLGADIKVIWELNRWQPLVRLAMAAYLLNDAQAGAKCLDWLEHWARHNPPYQGWNWTSALEAGLRLIQLTWMDALLEGAGGGPALSDRRQAILEQLLPPHVWFTWRHRSFGSSANNHLLGELAGLIVARVRWPGLGQWAPSLPVLQSQWEREVLAQFAEDGGNREQALNYHLFAWELCWQARLALAMAQQRLTPAVEERLARAAGFAVEVHTGRKEWPYGDSDDASVTPFFLDSASAGVEWRDWMARRASKAAPAQGAAIAFWLGDPPPLPARLASSPVSGSRHFPRSGMLLAHAPGWTVRWDLSSLGYLATAAHGHLDALHLSLWFRGEPIVIDPGTGAYYADAPVRAWLSSRAAHNGPCPLGREGPERHGPFLWSSHHAVPSLKPGTDLREGLLAVLNLPRHRLQRRLAWTGDGWTVEDSCVDRQGVAAPFTVHWQFAPDSLVQRISDRKFSLRHADVAVMIEVDDRWTDTELVEASGTGLVGHRPGTPRLPGLVAPSFRRLVRASFLLLTALPKGTEPCLFRTTFQASNA